MKETNIHISWDDILKEANKQGLLAEELKFLEHKKEELYAYLYQEIWDYIEPYLDDCIWDSIEQILNDK